MKGDLQTLEDMSKFSSCFIHDRKFDDVLTSDTVCHAVGVSLYDIAKIVVDKVNKYEHLDGHIVRFANDTTSIHTDEAVKFWTDMKKLCV